MVEVFFCTLDEKDKDAMRAGMAAVCLERWLKEPTVAMVPITPAAIGCSAEEFQRERRVFAEDTASSDIYVVADDDCLLENRDPAIVHAVAILRGLPDFGIVSFMPTNVQIMPWTPEDWLVADHAEVMEHVSVGGIRVCRKGALEDFPPAEAAGYDAIHCEALRDQGYRCGYYKNLKMNHLGEGYSQVW